MRAPDLTLAVRNLARRPAFAVTAVLLLALGAGANAAVFSVVRGILLRPLPYQQPERLIAVWPTSFVNNEDLDYWRARLRTVESLAAVSPGWLMALSADGVEPLNVTGGRTSDNFFTTLGVPAALGRTILPGDAAPARSTVVVLSAEVFERQFGADPRTIGRRVLLDSVEHEVIGVMPRGFEFLEPGTDVWAPLPYDPSSGQHRAQFSQAFARLAPGATVESASRELQALVPSMRADLGKTEDWGRDITAVQLRDSVVGTVRPTLLILLGAVGLILLLAAVNLGTLVLGRAVGRSREMALRAAIGASRWRLARQLLVEQLVIAALGAVTGLLLARAALPLLVRQIPAGMPRQDEIALDGVVFGVILATTIAVALVTTIVPVAIASRPRLAALLRQAHSTETPTLRRTFGALVAAQIALAVVLGIGAGLMLRSLWNLQQVDPGFESEGVLTFRLQTTSRSMPLAEGLVYFEQIIERVRALPGVTDVGAIQHLPLSGYNWTARVWRPEAPPPPGATPRSAIWRITGWDYFDTMRIPLRAGRAFSRQDDLNAPAVTIVNEALAEREFGSAQAAVGQRLTVAAGRAEDTVVEIVGVVRDVRFEALQTPADPEMYQPLAQTYMFPMTFVVRSAGAPADLGRAIRAAAFEVNPTVPVAEMQTLDSLLAGSLGRPRLLAWLLSIFAAAGLALGVIGVYGVVAYRVRQQEREFGIRLALGAGPDRIARRVLREGLVHAAVGLLIGVPAAFVLARVLASLVFGVTPHDAATFAALPLAVLLTTAAACAIPAIRAARVDPVQTMKVE